MIKAVCITNMYRNIKYGEIYLVQKSGPNYYRVCGINTPIWVIGKYKTDIFMLYSDWLALEREQQMKSILDD